MNKKFKLKTTSERLCDAVNFASFIKKVADPKLKNILLDLAVEYELYMNDLISEIYRLQGGESS